jgi:acyl-ACP thioesterase
MFVYLCFHPGLKFREEESVKKMFHLRGFDVLFFVHPENFLYIEIVRLYDRLLFARFRQS